MTNTFFWLLSTVFFSSVMGLYSMLEMSCISYNRLRLEFAVRQGSHRAIWIKKLLDKPTLLFGTTLIGVNLSLVLSSESMRQLFESLGINPNLSPLIEAPYMIICGELVPMFSARLYPEHVARLGIPLLWLSSRMLAPITLLLDTTFQLLRRLFLPDNLLATPPHLQRDELRDLIEEKKRRYFEDMPTQLESVVGRIFTLRDHRVVQYMLPLSQMPSVKTSVLCRAAKEILRTADCEYALVRNRHDEIVGYTKAFDLLNASETTSVGSIMRTATFVGEYTTSIDLLFRFKKERTEVSLIVGSGGEVVGLIILDDLLSELTRGTRRQLHRAHIEKTVSADVSVDEFLQRYHIFMPILPAGTFGELVEKLLGRKPSFNDCVYFGPLEMVVKEVGIRGAKTIFIKTVE